MRAAAVLLVALVLAPAAAAAGSSQVAALQIALRAKGVYAGPIDGLAGPATDRALRGFQRRHHLVADGVRTFYAHLSRVDVHVGARVHAGTRLGLVGATGDATGPHLHFEVRVRGAAVDPLPALR